MRRHGANHRIVRQIRLDNHAARPLSPARTARELFVQVKSALGSAKVGHLKSIVGIHHGGERYLGKVEVPFAIICVPRRTAHSAASKRSSSSLWASLPRVESASMRMTSTLSGQQLDKSILHLLGAQPHLRKISTSTLRTSRTHSRIGTHAIRSTAGVALKGMRALMIGKRRRAMLASWYATAFPAHQKGSESSAIMQKDSLLPTLRHAQERLSRSSLENIERLPPINSRRKSHMVTSGKRAAPGRSGMQTRSQRWPAYSPARQRARSFLSPDLGVAETKREGAPIDRSHNAPPPRARDSAAKTLAYKIAHVPHR